jgi:hypothetical protein
MATCSFSLKGSSLPECIDICNNETEDLCTSYCEDTCKQGFPISQNTTTTKPIQESSTCFNDLIQRIKNYSVLADKILENQNNISNSLDALSNVSDNEVKKDIIYNYLTSMYELSTDVISTNFESIKYDKTDIIAKKNLINKNKDSLRILLEILKTKERQYKMNMGKYNMMVYETRSLQYLFFYCIVLLLIPLLYLFGALNQIFAIIGWLMLVTIGIIYTLYKIKSNKVNRDQLFYSDFNFDKPTREAILRSRLDQGLDEQCDSKPKTADNEFEADDVDIGNISKWKNKVV